MNSIDSILGMIATEAFEELEVMWAQERDFKRIHGYDWPNCAIADCQWKSCIPFDRCYTHLSADEQREAMRLRENP